MPSLLRSTMLLSAPLLLGLADPASAKILTKKGLASSAHSAQSASEGLTKELSRDDIIRAKQVEERKLAAFYRETSSTRTVQTVTAANKAKSLNSEMTVDEIRTKREALVGVESIDGPTIMKYRYSNVPYDWGVWEGDGGALHRETYTYSLQLGRNNTFTVHPLQDVSLDDGCVFLTNASLNGGGVDYSVDFGHYNDMNFPEDNQHIIRFICDVKFEGTFNNVYINMWMDLESSGSYSTHVVQNHPVNLHYDWDAEMKGTSPEDDDEETDELKLIMGKKARRDRHTVDDPIPISNGVVVDGLPKKDNNLRVRVRLSSHKLDSSSGKALDGEVEDYLIDDITKVEEDGTVRRLSRRKPNLNEQANVVNKGGIPPIERTKRSNLTEMLSENSIMVNKDIKYKTDEYDKDGKKIEVPASRQLQAEGDTYVTLVDYLNKYASYMLWTGDQIEYDFDWQYIIDQCVLYYKPWLQDIISIGSTNAGLITPLPPILYTMSITDIMNVDSTPDWEELYGYTRRLQEYTNPTVPVDFIPTMRTNGWQPMLPGDDYYFMTNPDDDDNIAFETRNTRWLPNSMISKDIAAYSNARILESEDIGTYEDRKGKGPVNFMAIWRDPYAKFYLEKHTWLTWNEWNNDPRN